MLSCYSIFKQSSLIIINFVFNILLAVGCALLRIEPTNLFLVERLHRNPTIIIIMKKVGACTEYYFTKSLYTVIAVLLHVEIASIGQGIVCSSFPEVFLVDFLAP